MSVDHKPDNPEEAVRIKKAGGEVSNGRVNGNLNLSRAIGDIEYKRNKSIPEEEQLIISKPDVMEKPLQGVQHIVLGCDGIFQVKSNQNIYDLILVNQSQPLKETAESVISSLLAADIQQDHGMDNMTMIIARMK